MPSKLSLRLAAALLCLSAGTVSAQSVTGELMDAAVQTELSALAPNASYGAFVHFSAGSLAEQDSILNTHGLAIQADFRKYATSVFAIGPASAFRAIANESSVNYIEHNTPLRYMGETQSWATRARVAHEPVSGGPYYADAERTQMIDGSGVVLGIIDSGVFGAHPDFADNLMYNFKLINPTSITQNGPGYIEIGHNDSESQVGGHGTHVTGTVGGRGHASNGGYPIAEVAPNIPGTYAGAAPGADLIHWGNGAGLLVLDTAAAYNDMIQRLDAKEPGFDRLVAVNNSYGQDPAPYNPNSTASKLIKQIVARDVVMAFAASNDGGDGSTAQTSPACRDTTPGVICVASYNDLGSGHRNAPLSGFSSRGQKSDTTTNSYPDIAAPGDLITSTCLQGLPSQAVCSTGGETDWQPYYGTISGTSMATPHVVGLIGLIQQAAIAKTGNRLNPAQVEEIMQRTAKRVGPVNEYIADPQLTSNYPGLGQTNIHYGYGAGLVDLPSILDALGVDKAGYPVSGQLFTVFDGDVDSGLSDDVLKLSMQDATVNGLPGTMHHLTLAASDDFYNGTYYRIERNVAGIAATTTVVTDGSGVFSIPAAGNNNTAPATQVSRNGAVVSVFVPASNMGFPAIGEAVHNIRVVTGDDMKVWDVSPSPAGGVDPEVDLYQSMFGRAFTVMQAAGIAPPSQERSCTAPGITQFVAPAGTSGLATTETKQEDLLHGWIAEPSDKPGKLVFTLKMDNLNPAPIPSHRWYFYFTTPHDNNNHWVAMDTTLGLPRFLYGTRVVFDPSGALGVGVYTDSGTTTGSWNVDGTITITLDKALLNLVPGDVLGAVAASIRQSSNAVNAAGLTVDSGAGNTYPIVGNAACARPDGSIDNGGSNTAPVANASSATVQQDSSVEITLSASDADGDSLTFAIASAPSNGSLGAVSGDKVTYTPNAGYFGSDSFTFKANDGSVDSAAAAVTITVNEVVVQNDADGDGVADDVDNCPAVSNAGQANFDGDSQGDACDTDDDNDGILDGEENAGCQFNADTSCGEGDNGNNGTLDAELSITTDSSDAYTVSFDASASHYEENADAINGAMYRFVFGDGTQTPAQASAVISHTYEAAGDYTAYVVVTDANGNAAKSEDVTVSIVATVTVTDGGANAARLKVANASGPAPLTVSFDATSSTTAQGYTITGYSWDFDGDGNVDLSGSNGKVTHVYTRAGSYTPSVTVSFSNGSETASSVAKAAVNAGTNGGGTTPVAAAAGGGSLGWLLLMPLLGAALARRRKTLH